MESSKIKNILIAILLFVNLGLLGLIWNDHQQSRENTRQAMESLERVFANRGISMEQVDLPENSALMTYGMSRDLDREQKLVEQVLGTVTVEDQGGNIMYYYGEKGQASFRGTGDFEILFSDGAVTGEEDPAATAKKMLRKMGIQAKIATSGQEKDSDTVTATAIYGDSPVMNSQIRFHFAGNELLKIEGQRILDTVQTETDTKALDAATLMTRFLGVLDRSDSVCSEIRSVRNVWLYLPDATGGRLQPVCEIQTNGKSFYLNVSTGEEQPVT